MRGAPVPAWEGRSRARRGPGPQAPERGDRGGGARDAAPHAGLRIALVGNHPPRRCGLATYTRDVAAALRGAGHRVLVVAMNDGSMPADAAGVDVLVDAGARDDHRRAGRAVDAWHPDMVLVEHEYGIFGGPAGAWLLDLLGAIRAPAVATLHTVLDAPDPDQARVLDALLARCARVVVMAERGRDMLAARVAATGRPAPAVAVVPHGAPDLPPAHPAAMRRRLGWDERPTALTFGLLGPGKGIETMIEAMPAILARVPEARYVLLGATHPHLAAREGEAYRDRLAARARELGVAGAVRMIARYVDDAELCDALRAADVYVTPYPHAAQITSGTLAYAFALGLPIVSTPYWHAEELLGAEALVPFRDPPAMADKVAGLLADPTWRAAIGAANRTRGRGTVWSVHARRLTRVLRDALADAAPAPPDRLARPAEGHTIA